MSCWWHTQFLGLCFSIGVWWCGPVFLSRSTRPWSRQITISSWSTSRQTTWTSRCGIAADRGEPFLQPRRDWQSTTSSPPSPCTSSSGSRPRPTGLSRRTTLSSRLWAVRQPRLPSEEAPLQSRPPPRLARPLALPEAAGSESPAVWRWPGCPPGRRWRSGGWRSRSGRGSPRGARPWRGRRAGRRRRRPGRGGPAGPWWPGRGGSWRCWSGSGRCPPGASSWTRWAGCCPRWRWRRRGRGWTRGGGCGRWRRPPDAGGPLR